jgi:hypothetical protein
MKAICNSLAFAGLAAFACVASNCSPAQAQTPSFGYTVPGSTVHVTTGTFSDWGEYFYYGVGYPVVAPGPVLARPVVPGYVRAPVILRSAVVVRRPYVVARPYVRYYPGYYHRVWR